MIIDSALAVEIIKKVENPDGVMSVMASAGHYAGHLGVFFLLVVSVYIYIRLFTEAITSKDKE